MTHEELLQRQHRTIEGLWSAVEDLLVLVDDPSLKKTKEQVAARTAAIHCLRQAGWKTAAIRQAFGLPTDTIKNATRGISRAVTECHLCHGTVVVYRKITKEPVCRACWLAQHSPPTPDVVRRQDTCSCGKKKRKASKVCKECAYTARRTGTRKCACGNKKASNATTCWECYSKVRPEGNRPSTLCACGAPKQKRSMTCRKCWAPTQQKGARP